MKLLIFLFLLVLLYVLQIDYIPIEEPTKVNILVSIKYLDKIKVVELVKGSRLIDLKELYPDVNYANLNYNPLSILHDNDYINLDIKLNKACISINTATYEELTSLPGIKDALANKIIAYRDQRLFMNVEDIMLVDGIKLAKFNQIKDLICI